MGDAPMTLADICDDAVYTPKQIGDVLHTPPRRIAKAFRDGELAGIELGPKTIRITGRAVKEWLNQKNQRTSSASSVDQAASSPADNGASTSSRREKTVKDLVLGSL
jgi:hypothetical protein